MEGGSEALREKESGLREARRGRIRPIWEGWREEEEVRAEREIYSMLHDTNTTHPL